jgi:hypothetical protein
MSKTPFYQVTIGNEQIPSLKIKMQLRELDSPEMKTFIHRYLVKYCPRVIPTNADFSILGLMFVDCIGQDVVKKLLDYWIPEKITEYLNEQFNAFELLGSNDVQAIVKNIELEHSYAFHRFTTINAELEKEEG